MATTSWVPGARLLLAVETDSDAFTGFQDTMLFHSPSNFGAYRQADPPPASLDRCVRHPAQTAGDSSGPTPHQTPFAIGRNGARLVVRLVRVARDTLLLLEEPATRSDRLLSAHEAQVLLESLQDVMTDAAPMWPEVASPAIELRDGPSHVAHQLTPHEVRLLGMLAEGHGYKTAAAALGSSVHTVAFHMKHIYAKLQVHSKSEAVAKALRDRIVR